MSTRHTVTATTANTFRVNVTTNANASFNECISRAGQYLTALGFSRYEQVVTMHTDTDYRIVGQAQGKERTSVMVALAATHYVHI